MQNQTNVINITSGLQIATVESKGASALTAVINAGARRTDEIESVDALPAVENVWNRYVEVFNNDLFKYVLYHSDAQTLINLRLVMKKIYDFSMQSLSFSMSPLMCKILIPIKIEKLTHQQSDKLTFALKNTCVCIDSIEINHLQNPALLCDKIDVEKANLCLAFKINNNNELNQFSALLSSGELSDIQELIIRKITELKFDVNIEIANTYDIKTVMNFFAQKKSFQLTTLQFGDINAALCLPELHSLTTLKFGSIGALLTLPQFPNLIKLSFSSINAALTLPELPSLTGLWFQDINKKLTLPELPSLTGLWFQDINKKLTLPELPRLIMLWAHDIKFPLTLPSLQNLELLSFQDICATLTLPELQSLTTLLFRDIKTALTLPNFQNLLRLNFGSIHAALILPELQSLRELEFESIYAALTLPEFPNLTTLSFSAIKAALTLLKLPSLTELKFGRIDAALTLPETFSKLTTIKYNKISIEKTREYLRAFLSNNPDVQNLSISLEDNIEVKDKVVINKQDQELSSSYAKYYAALAFFFMLYLYFG